MPGKDHSAKAMKLLEDYGYISEKVEQYNPRSRRSKDFCGFADVLAFRFEPWDDKFLPLDEPGIQTPYQGVLAVQACNFSTLTEHVRTVTDVEHTACFLKSWLALGNRFEIWAFPSPRDKTAKWGRSGPPPKFRRFSLPGVRLHNRAPNFVINSATELTPLGYMPHQPKPAKKRGG